MDVQLDFRGDLPRAEREQLERLVGCFLKALGHELPNRLVALQGLARLLEADAGDRLDADGRAALVRLADLTRGVDSLVRHLADIGRLSRDPGRPEEASLAEAAREAAAEVKMASGKADVTYHFNDDSFSLPVSQRSLGLVLVELLRNAVQAAAPGRPPRVEIGGRRTSEGVEWWVKDDGRGFPAGRREAPFEAFAAGGGLGLFLVRQVVAAWGGAVRVQSQPEMGTTVTVVLRRP
jgi:signal transduction histidine kinase